MENCLIKQTTLCIAATLGMLTFTNSSFTTKVVGLSLLFGKW